MTMFNIKGINKQILHSFAATNCDEWVEFQFLGKNVDVAVYQFVMIKLNFFWFSNTNVGAKLK